VVRIFFYGVFIAAIFLMMISNSIQANPIYSDTSYPVAEDSIQENAGEELVVSDELDLSDGAEPEVNSSEREILREKIEALVRPVVEAQGYKLYDVEPPLRSGAALRIYIWKGAVSADAGIGSNEGMGRREGVVLDDCARVSKAIELITQLDDVIEGNYVQEVSSPGVNRKLPRLEHFRSAVGEFARVVTNAGQVFSGNIISVDCGALKTGEIVMENHNKPGQRDDEGLGFKKKAGKRSPSKGKPPDPVIENFLISDVKRARIDFQFKI